MSTDLKTIAQSSVKVRFKEPLQSEAINRARLVVPRGVHRGFNLAASASPLSVVLEVDAGSGDSVAVVHDSDDRALTIRESANATLDLSSFASSTVVVAIYAEHVTQGTTTAVVRGYEVDPVDELTGDPSEDYLILLGTVVVPAAGVIPAANITHQRRIMAADEAFAQAVRVPLVLNHDFSQAYEGASFVTASSSVNEGVLLLANRWVARGASGQDSETTQYLVDGTGLTVRTDGSGDYEIVVTQDVGAPLGDLGVLSADWRLEIEVNYDVLSVEAGATASVICKAVAQGEPTRDWEFSVDLDLSAAATGLVAAANIDMASALDTLAAVQLDAAGVAVLSGVQISGALSGGTASTSVLKINSVQAFIRHNPRTAGFKDPDKRVDAPVSSAALQRLLAFIPHAAASVTDPQWRYDVDPGAAPKIMASSDNPRFAGLALLQIQDAILGTVSPIVVEQWLTGTLRDDPRFKAQFDAVNELTTIWEAEGATGTEPSLRAVASTDGRLYLTVNARPDSGDWTRDTAGNGSMALVLSAEGIRQRVEFRQVSAASWNDASWDSVYDLGPRSHYTVMTDSSQTFGGDVDTGLADRLHTGTSPLDVKLLGFNYNFSSGLTGALKEDIKVVGVGAQLTSINLNDAAPASHLRLDNRSYFSDVTFTPGNTSHYLGSDGDRSVMIERARFLGVNLVLPGVTGSDGSDFDEFILKDAYFDSYPNTAADLGYSAVIVVKGMAECRFENVYIDSPGFAGTSSRMVFIQGGKNILFENCKFRTFQSGWECVRIDSGLQNNITFRNCTFENYATAGTGTPLVFSANNLVANAVFDNCYFFSREGVAVDVEGGFTFRNCKFESETSTTATEPVLISALGDTTDQEGFTGRPTFINCIARIGSANLDGASTTRGVIELFGEVIVDGFEIAFSNSSGALHAGPILELAASYQSMHVKNVKFNMSDCSVPADTSSGLINIEPATSGHIFIEGTSFTGFNTTANAAGRPMFRITNQGDVTIRDTDVNGLGSGANGFNNVITCFSFGPVVIDNLRVSNFSRTMDEVILIFSAQNVMIRNCIFELPDTVGTDHAIGVDVSGCEQLSIINTWMHASENGNAFVRMEDVLNVTLTNCQFRCDGANDSDEFVDLVAGTNDTMVFSNNLLVGDNGGSPLTTIDFSTITTATIIGNVFRNLGGGGITITYGGSNIGGNTLNKEA
jgi:hypothetical protein